MYLFQPALALVGDTCLVFAHLFLPQTIEGQKFELIFPSLLIRIKNIYSAGSDGRGWHNC